MKIIRRFLVATAVFASFLSTDLRAQAVVLDAVADEPALRVLQDVIARGDYLVLQRDTVLGAEFHSRQDVIVWDARVRLSGTVEGSLVAVRGSVFVRPNARIGGPIAAVGGLVLPSALADIGEVIELPPHRAVRVTREPGLLRVGVLPSPEVPRLGLGGLFGVRRVAYDRVDGLSVAWGPQWRITGQEFGPRADAWLTVRTTRRPGGGARLLLPLGGTMEAVLGAERVTRTNEDWIRGRLTNSIGALLLGRDVREYYESDAAWVRLGRTERAGGMGALRFAPYLEVSHARDRSLQPASRFAAFGRSQLDRSNRAVIEDRLVAGELGSGVEWLGTSTRFEGLVLVEHGRLREADVEFTRWQAGAQWEMQALWYHSLRVRGHGRGALGDHPAPAQRWSSVGGQGTLPTLPLAFRHGDRVAFIESLYSVPLPWDPPFVGNPALELLHATGTAWHTGVAMPDWDQNLGLGLASSWLRARAWIDPAAGRGARPTFVIEIASP